MNVWTCGPDPRFMSRDVSLAMDTAWHQSHDERHPDPESVDRNYHGDEYEDDEAIEDIMLGDTPGSDDPLMQFPLDPEDADEHFTLGTA